MALLDELRPVAPISTAVDIRSSNVAVTKGMSYPAPPTSVRPFSIPYFVPFTNDTPPDGVGSTSD